MKQGRQAEPAEQVRLVEQVGQELPVELAEQERQGEQVGREQLVVPEGQEQ